MMFHTFLGVLILIGYPAQSVLSVPAISKYNLQGHNSPL